MMRSKNPIFLIHPRIFSSSQCLKLLKIPRFRSREIGRKIVWDDIIHWPFESSNIAKRRKSIGTLWRILTPLGDIPHKSTKHNAEPRDHEMIADCYHCTHDWLLRCYTEYLYIIAKTILFSMDSAQWPWRIWLAVRRSTMYPLRRWTSSLFSLFLRIELRIV